ncbi:MAG: hypothetical protein CMI16_09600 [Opitutaceae bacterium]|nr:hypothetical protein [Opitutaceae bacterium]|tara:strand:- start:24 stop:977 length:954 start_codon:yes stop_codon:yes gene_type:complete
MTPLPLRPQMSNPVSPSAAIVEEPSAAIVEKPPKKRELRYGKNRFDYDKALEVFAHKKPVEYISGEQAGEFLNSHSYTGKWKPRIELLDADGNRTGRIDGDYITVLRYKGDLYFYVGFKSTTEESDDPDILQIVPKELYDSFEVDLAKMTKDDIARWPHLVGYKAHKKSQIKPGDNNWNVANLLRTVYSFKSRGKDTAPPAKKQKGANDDTAVVPLSGDAMAAQLINPQANRGFAIYTEDANVAKISGKMMEVMQEKAEELAVAKYRIQEMQKTIEGKDDVIEKRESKIIELRGKIRELEADARPAAKPAAKSGGKK